MDEFSWFIGLFEGEGSFHIQPSKTGHRARGLVIQMTDRDVLERVHKLLGGNLGETKRHNSPTHWKRCWRWQLPAFESEEVVIKMLPFLSYRRQERANEYLALVTPRKRLKEEQKLLRDKVLSLRDDGLSVKAIAKQINKNHSWVALVIRNSN